MPDWTDFEAVEEPKSEPDWSQFEPVEPKQESKPTPVSTAQYVAGGGPMAGMAIIPSTAASPTSPFIPIPKISIPGELGDITANFKQGLAAPYNVIAGLVEGAESPLGVATATLGPIPKAGQALIGAGMGLPAVARGLKDVYEGTALGEPQKAAEGVLNTFVGGGLVGGAAKGLLERESPPSGVSGEAKPGAAPVSQAVETPVTAGESPQAVAETVTPLPTKQGVNVTPDVTQQPQGIAASVRNKWTTATEPTTRESGFINLDPIRELVDKATPYVKSAFEAVKEIGNEAKDVTNMTDYRRSVLKWSGRLQKSFSEASEAQKDIYKEVPNEDRQDGITNWIQAGGDPAVLAQRRAATESWRDPVTGKPHPQRKQLLAGYDAALDLTPQEIAVANDVKNAYDKLGQRGKLYNVLNSFKDNYVTQIWDLGKSPKGIGGSRTLRDKFKFSKASSFPTFFDGEQAGYVPKTKAIGKILPVYLHEMNSVIAARQLVEQLSKGVGSDGRPLVSPKGSGTTVKGPDDEATLITPKTVKEGTEDYKTISNQPALHDWIWATKDAQGNPVFLKSDLAIHPEAYDRLNAALGKSAIREWYSTKTSAAAQIPKTIVKAIDYANSGTKRTMLGLLAPFHQVQEGTHAVGHRINPFFRIPKVDLVADVGQADAAQHGLMLLPDRASANQFMEGFKPSGLVSRIPGIGPLADFYSNYLFHEYIPGLKYKTYQAIVSRNSKVFANELASAKLKMEDVKTLSAEQANAAYGHLNYADLGRNPTIQHLATLGLLAPDFLESRARFTVQALKGAAGTKVGREQVIALGALALAQAATAYTSSKITGGDWDAKRPFEFTLGRRRYTMRSVPEDISSLLHNTRSFVYSRLSPIIGRGGVQYLSQTDWRGKKVTAGETTKELLEQPIPISIRGFTGLANSPLSGLEQLAGAVGLKISRYNPDQDKIDEAVKINDLGDKISSDMRRMPISQRYKFVTESANKQKFTELEKNKLVNHLRKKGAFSYPPEE
jgi:hypothetical protein